LSAIENVIVVFKYDLVCFVADLVWLLKKEWCCSGWPLTWKTWKSQGIPVVRENGKSQGNS